MSLAYKRAIFNNSANVAPGIIPRQSGGSAIAEASAFTTQKTVQWQKKPRYTHKVGGVIAPAMRCAPVSKSCGCGEAVPCGGSCAESNCGSCEMPPPPRPRQIGPGNLAKLATSARADKRTTSNQICSKKDFCNKYGPDRLNNGQFDQSEFISQLSAGAECTGTINYGSTSGDVECKTAMSVNQFCAIAETQRTQVSGNWSCPTEKILSPATPGYVYTQPDKVKFACKGTYKKVGPISGEELTRLTGACERATAQRQWNNNYYVGKVSTSN